MAASSPPFSVWQEYSDVFGFFLPRARMLLQFFGGDVTSWFRDSVENRRVGGHELSQHRLGFAFDWVGQDMRNFQLAAEQLGFIAIDEGDHVHVQFFQAGVVSHLISRLHLT